MIRRRLIIGLATAYARTDWKPLGVLGWHAYCAFKSALDQRERTWAYLNLVPAVHPGEAGGTR